MNVSYAVHGDSIRAEVLVLPAGDVVDYRLRGASIAMCEHLSDLASSLSTVDRGHVYSSGIQKATFWMRPFATATQDPYFVDDDDNDDSKDDDDDDHSNSSCTTESDLFLNGWYSPNITIGSSVPGPESGAGDAIIPDAGNRIVGRGTGIPMEDADNAAADTSFDSWRNAGAKLGCVAMWEPVALVDVAVANAFGLLRNECYRRMEVIESFSCGDSSLMSFLDDVPPEEIHSLSDDVATEEGSSAYSEYDNFMGSLHAIKSQFDLCLDKMFYVDARCVTIDHLFAYAEDTASCTAECEPTPCLHDSIECLEGVPEDCDWASIYPVIVWCSVDGVDACHEHIVCVLWSRAVDGFRGLEVTCQLAFDNFKDLQVDELMIMNSRECWSEHAMSSLHDYDGESVENSVILQCCGNTIAFACKEHYEEMEQAKLNESYDEKNLMLESGVLP
jgi:hypothetical protein